MDYQFKPLGKKCAGTGQDLVPGSVCISVLIPRGDELIRLDYSAAGWKGPPSNAVGHWKSIVPVPQPVSKRMLDGPALLAYFEQLTEEGDPTLEKLRFILALLLLQKRQFKLEGSRTDPTGEEWLQFVSTTGEGQYEVRDLQLEDEEMQQLQEQLNARLAVEWGEVPALNEVADRAALADEAS